MELDEKAIEDKVGQAIKIAAIRDRGMIKLQGKEYLPVADRILAFRVDHPDASIRVQFETVGESTVAVCQVLVEGRCLAQAHKSVQSGGKGPAGKYPLEMAETGSIGRALGLCGYGTLSGDLDEGDQIADAPQSSSKRKW